jgi:predicted metalloendopeptidase
MHTSEIKLGKPVDKSEWFTTPSTVTAYNNPSANEIVFQQVFYSLLILIKADDS